LYLGFFRRIVKRHFHISNVSVGNMLPMCYGLKGLVCAVGWMIGNHGSIPSKEEREFFLPYRIKTGNKGPSRV
jgi:hypothetical protein